MGDYIYAFSAEGVTVTNYTSMNLSASIDLPERDDIPYYWDDIEYDTVYDEVRADSDDGDGDGAGSSSGSSEESDPDRD
jgi:hypothetical protein